MIDLKQKKLADWEERNFGRHDDDVLKVALGMAEEVGEVCHHVLKGTQKIRGGLNGLNKAEIADGVADTLIYGIQLLSRLGMDAEKEISAVIDKVLARDWKKNPEGDKENIQTGDNEECVHGMPEWLDNCEECEAPDEQNYPAEVVFNRHPSEYRLIAKEGSDFDHPLHGYKNLFRIIPGHTVPEGYIEVTKVNGASVFEHDGRLRPKFIGLQRMIGLDKV